MNIQLHQTVKLKSGYCKGKMLPEADNMGICFLVQIIEGPTSKNFDYSVGSKLIILKEDCWKYTQKIKINNAASAFHGEVVSEQRIVFPIKNIVGTIMDTEGQSDGTGDRK